ncbi:hypothetical protein BK669_04120 [Pseudomonas fluorescens]|nr:hypothetical protein BK669_04120 [Pseudomonas fluorescens]
MMIKRLLDWLGFSEPASRVVKTDEPLSVPPQLSPPDYFSQDWAQRKRQLLTGIDDSFLGGFAAANGAEVARIALADGKNAHLHVIFNLGADALAQYMRTDNYQNAYERPVVGSKVLEPSKKRQTVDEMLGLKPAKNFYFCAASIAGTGIRFYGDFCVALKSPADKASVKQGLDRNSYDLVVPPLDVLMGCKSRVDSLKFRFREPEFADMLAIKVLQHQAMRPRRLTIGNIGDAVLSDEDYVELFHEGKIRRDTILEVRSHPEDEMTETVIDSRQFREGGSTPAQILWLQQRQIARQEMAEKGIVHRVVRGSGRVYRWS